MIASNSNGSSQNNMTSLSALKKKKNSLQRFQKKALLLFFPVLQSYEYSENAGIKSKVLDIFVSKLILVMQSLES